MGNVWSEDTHLRRAGVLCAASGTGKSEAGRHGKWKSKPFVANVGQLASELICGLQSGCSRKKLQDSLEEAKTSNRLLSRALSAVQHRLKQAEGEREQLRRERDYFRNLALRFPFTLSVGGYDNVYGAARRHGTER